MSQDHIATIRAALDYSDAQRHFNVPIVESALESLAALESDLKAWESAHKEWVRDRNRWKLRAEHAEGKRDELRANVEAIRAEIALAATIRELRAKLAECERQRPVAWRHGAVGAVVIEADEAVQMMREANPCWFEESK